MSDSSWLTVDVVLAIRDDVDPATPTPVTDRPALQAACNAASAFVERRFPESFADPVVTPVEDPNLDALDGVSDPWRWSDLIGGWISPAYRVTWEAGDVFSSGPGVVTSPVSAHYVAVVEGEDVTLESGVLIQAGSVANTGAAGASAPMAEAGSGVIYRVQNEPDFAHTVVPDAADSVLDYVGDLVVVEPYVWPVPDPIVSPAVFNPDDDVRLGAVMLALRYYERRGTLMGVAGFSPEFGPSMILRTDPDIARLLKMGPHAPFVFGAPTLADTDAVSEFTYLT